MSSTNKTTNYELSQFVGSDKPAWLTDYNQDMSKIDTGIHAAQSSATSASGKADANTTNIGDLSYLSTTAKNTVVAAINEVDNKSETAQGTANTASIDATTALAKVNELLAALNLNDHRTPNVSVTAGNTISVSSSTIRSAVNSTGTIGKVYGKVDLTGTGNGSNTITIANTGFQPQSEFSVSGHAYAIENATANGTTVYARYITDLTMVFKTNGDITIDIQSFNGLGGRVMLDADLIFATDFGD